MSRSIVILLLALALLILVPVVVRAADEVRPVTKAASVVARPGVTEAAPRAERPARTPEEKALRAVEDEGQAQVEALVKSMQGLQDGPVLRALQRKVEEVKQAQHLEFLRVKARFARERGDLATIKEAERLIQAILNPPKPVATPAVRQTPDKNVQEGGRP